MSSIKVGTGVLRETIAPTVEPVSTTEAKLHLRVTSTSEDSLIALYISAAREYCENYLQKALTSHTYVADLPGFYDIIDLPMKPIHEVQYVKYYSTASPSVLTDLYNVIIGPNVTTEVFNIVKGNIYRNSGQTWPAHATRPDAIQISYQAGYVSSPPNSIPGNIKAAILLLVGDMYENREAQSMGAEVHQNKTVDRLLDMEREYR